jgi:hypothetical protein
MINTGNRVAGMGTRMGEMQFIWELPRGKSGREQSCGKHSLRSSFRMMVNNAHELASRNNEIE